MKFTFNWLKESLAYSGTPERLAELLTMAGLEVESLTSLREPETERQDWLFEIAVTPNRGDCLGIAGIAREVAALTGNELRALPESPADKDSAIKKRIRIKIEDAQLCARYSARIAEDVRVAPSPAWLRHRLEACGIRAINNVVDVTNYTMLETGQPLHAFDLDRLSAKQIVVRAAGPTSQLTTLDGVDRELRADDLLICDADHPIALAGVMGGSDSEVSDVTKSVLLESANFSPSTIRRTAKRLALHSEASHRFERGVDPEGTIAALNRAIYLLDEITGGRALNGVLDVVARKVKTLAIILRQDRIEKLLGLKLDLKQAEKILNSLGMKTRLQSKNRSLSVIPPASRPDINREADLIEELARLHGYGNIPTTLPHLRSTGGKIDGQLRWERNLRGYFSGEGFFEVINLPFTTENLNKSFTGLWQSPQGDVAVLNPLAKDYAAMRHSLLPGLIDNLRFNLAHKARSFSAFHLGKVFSLAADGPSEERQSIAGVLYGPRSRLGLRQGEEAPRDFFACKGLVEGILDLFHLADGLAWASAQVEFLHPLRSSVLFYNDTNIGYLGELHPDMCDQLALPSVLLFELDFEKLLEYAPRQTATHALSRFPAVERDVAIVVDVDFAAQKIIGWIKNLGEALIEHVEIFDQYVGAPVPKGKKSLAYKVSYRAEDRTLTDSEINLLHQSLVERLRYTFSAEQRS